MSEISEISLKIGPYELHPVPTGEFGLDGGAMFGTVPKVLWEQTNPPNENNQILMEARALLLKSHDKSTKKNILIDTGNGAHFVEKYGAKLGNNFGFMYGVKSEPEKNEPNRASLENSLKRYSLTPDDITDVILTHLHFDHAGGATKAQNGKIVPTFKNATYYVQKENLKTAQQPNVREKQSYLPANFQPLLDHNVLKLLDGPQENLLPNISVILSYGHTHAHQMVKISDDKNTLVYCGDVVPTRTHLKPAWIMGYDLNPLQIIDEKNKLLKEATEKNWYLYFEHDPYCDLATANGTPYRLL